tara:strand:- start:21 stop:311 length:291 start_codon:yes stop_codon:yes gene_type:complete
MNDFNKKDINNESDLNIYLNKYIKYKTKYEELLKKVNSKLNFKKGQNVLYKDSSGIEYNAEIIEVHNDDLEPYYTIFIFDKKIEKQTIASKIKLIQ